MYFLCVNKYCKINVENVILFDYLTNNISYELFEILTIEKVQFYDFRHLSQYFDKNY